MMREEAAVLRETAPMNILIVDDEPSIREACGEVARLTGMNATMVATAEEPSKFWRITPSTSC